MTRLDLHDLTVAQLIQRFAAMGVEQDKAEIWGDNAKVTQLFWQMEAVENELKIRPGDERKALLTLYDHPNVQVRLKAAKATLAVAPDDARRLLQIIASSRRQPQAGDAGMCLWALDEGIFVPE